MMQSEDVVMALAKKRNDPDWLVEKRKEAFASYQKLPMPSFKYGIGIYVNVGDLKLEEIDPLEGEEQSILSNVPGIEVMNFQDAMKKHESLVKDHLFSTIKGNDNKLMAMHKAFLNNGIFVYIPKDTVVQEPLNLQSVLRNGSLFDHILVVAEESSQVTIIEHSTSAEQSTAPFRSQVIELIAKDNARIEYASVQQFDGKVYNFSHKFSSIARDGNVYWLDCTIGSRFTQSNTINYLQGEGSDAKSWGIFYGDEKQNFDINAQTIHNGAHSTCDMFVKGILNGKAKTIYRGLVKISEGVKGCEGYQKADTLLLGDGAEADVVPNLEISNNEVKCSHGATVGQLDEDQVFYLMSRGLDRQSATRAIVEGFLEPIIREIKNEEISKQVSKVIAKRIGAAS